MVKPNQDRLTGTEDVFRSLAKALAPYLRDAFGQGREDEPEYYHQDNSPLGRRRHLALVRSGALKGRKIGKRVLVARKEMRAFLEEHPTATVTLADPLDDWGLTRRRR